jgi:hypothetical protein
MIPSTDTASPQLQVVTGGGKATPATGAQGGPKKPPYVH